ncbi:MAG: ammonia-forming cytochrome c nitrite reductase subunit c552 [Coriobacteriales bacterium]|nr:ammonia-forming cytochrome c nitrite reductase subunit c552 [Coriobacteriales bacterium]
MGKYKKLLALVAVLGAVAVIAAVGCAGKPNPGYPTPRAERAAVTPAPDKFGVVKAEQWKDIYPLQYESYMMNGLNKPPAWEYDAAADTTTVDSQYKQADFIDEKADYLEMYPEIKTLGKGYGYAKYYTEPAGHVYSLWSVTHNGRVNDKTKAGCITCKTPQFSNDVDKYGDEIFQDNFFERIAQYDENISCASCHANDPTTLEVDRKDWRRAMGEDATRVPLQGQVCGQCHCDYSMDPVTGVATSPYYGGVASMTPDSALQWYDEHGYVDWTYESTGAQMLAVRHAEFEFCYGGEGSHMINMGYNCNDCHMAAKFSEDGVAYSDHYWSSPLENADLIARDCSTCHKDITAEVRAWQEELDGRAHQIGLRAEQFVFNFEDAVKAGTLSDEELARLQYIQRAACYYWNFVTAENSEGAHNPTLVNDTLDKAEALLDEGDQILGKSSKLP